MNPLLSKALNNFYQVLPQMNFYQPSDIANNYASSDSQIGELLARKEKGVQIQTNANGVGKELNMYDYGTKLSDQWAQMAS